MLNARHTNLILWLAAGLLACGSVAAVAAGWLLPMRAAGRAPVARAASGGPTTIPVTDLPPLEAFESFWSRPFRAPVGQALPVPGAPPPPPAVVTSAMAQPASSMTLMGTVGKSLAIIRLADGSTVLKAVGEEVGGARVVSIRPTQVELQLNGQMMRLAKTPGQYSATQPAP